MGFVHRELKEKKVKKNAATERQYPEGRFNLGSV